MGLDQYLTKKTSIYAQYDFEKIGGEINLTKDGTPIPINLKRVSTINEEVMYWRKANQIHNWFVNNVQEGEDDCREHYVSIEQLKELLKLCRKVMRNKDQAAELLPPTKGFFFGSYDIDEWYFKDIENTIKALADIIKEEKKKPSGVHTYYYYDSSW